MNEIKIAVIGTGHLGSIHTKLWKSIDGAKLEGIFDVNQERVKELAAEHGCTPFASVEEAIDAVDAVTIAAPTSLHFEIACKAIKAGKHCFIEKPITATNEEATKLIELAESKKVLIQVGHVERFNPALAALKDYKVSPLFIEAHRLSQFRPRAIDVSVIHDLMIHDIDIMLSMAKSKVTSIDANGVNVLTDTTDIANARIKFENGCVANLTASRISASPMRKMRVFGKDAYFSIDFGKPDVDVYRLLEDTDTPKEGTLATMLGTIEAGLKNKNIVFEKPEVPQLNAIAEEQKAFVEAISEGKPIAVNAKDAAEALRIAEAIAKMV